jgi:hypothetical protein
MEGQILIFDIYISFKTVITFCKLHLFYHSLYFFVQIFG